ncbi:hypothetical protein OGAPHI_004985 [Ogataea philodendri]|uniref:Uncharacterized protein n=1 Tax=Ogataea philodendri TaxID=1378263 RepID=A0A9P8P2P4_9ASCO|nr:uncharacterized protein OGAPHI_004985 [Ogataea philodendri]KAH3663584.1 hypothetical protein OGAPHI_004985 [Ogataea philodendri]
MLTPKIRTSIMLEYSHSGSHISVDRSHDLRGQGHCDRNSRAKTKSGNQKTSVSVPEPVSVCGDHHSDDDDDCASAEKDRTQFLELVSERSHQQNPTKVKQPNRSVQQRNVNSREVRVQSTNQRSSKHRQTETGTNNTEIHEDQRPHTDVQNDGDHVFPAPVDLGVSVTHVLFMSRTVPFVERLRRREELGNGSREERSGWLGQVLWPVWQPPD